VELASCQAGRLTSLPFCSLQNRPPLLRSSISHFSWSFALKGESAGGDFSSPTQVFHSTLLAEANFHSKYVPFFFSGPTSLPITTTNPNQTDPLDSPPPLSSLCLISETEPIEHFFFEPQTWFLSSCPSFQVHPCIFRRPFIFTETILQADGMGR